MTFQTDPEHTRAFDPERGLELFRRGPGPGAWNAFEIVGPSVSIAFLGKQTVTDETKGRPDYSGDPCLEILFNTKYSPEQELIAEALVHDAMTAYKAVFGFSRPGVEFAVKFLPWGTDIG